MEFSRPEYWSVTPFPSPGNLPNPGIEPRSPALQVILYQLSHKGSPFLSKETLYFLLEYPIITSSEAIGILSTLIRINPFTSHNNAMTQILLSAPSYR